MCRSIIFQLGILMRTRIGNFWMNKIPRKNHLIWVMWECRLYLTTQIAWVLRVPESPTGHLPVIGLAINKKRTILVKSSFCSGNDEILVESDPFASWLNYHMGTFREILYSYIIHARNNEMWFSFTILIINTILLGNYQWSHLKPPLSVWRFFYMNGKDIITLERNDL